MEDSKDYFVTSIVTKEEMQCNGYMDFLLRHMKEQISNGILDIVSDGNEYVIKMLPEQRIEKPDMLSVEIRQGISVEELVRCRECKRWGSPIPIEMKEMCYGYCSAIWSNTHENEYCAWGERKDDE